MNNAEIFVKYIRTKQFFKQRLKGDEHNPLTAVYINSEEIEQRFFPFPKYNKKAELTKLVQIGEIEINTTGKAHSYRVLNPGGIDISLLKRKAINYGIYTKQMRDNLQTVSLTPGAESTKYFDLFLKHRKNYIDYFFTVDEFSGRVHTPVSGLNKEYRVNLLINGQPTASLDVAQMQPTLLGKILQNEIGINEFSTWINEGKDIYNILQEKAGLPDRDAAKKYFFTIAFGKPDNALYVMFGAANWITWINDYKSRNEPRNNSDKVHSNLAWLLQTTEVKTMQKIWKLLVDAGIIFCSVHDEIIVKASDNYKAKELMSIVLSESFEHYQIKFHCKAVSLKDLFKAEFLKEQVPKNQLEIWREYQCRGLHPVDAKEVTNELINEHGFVVVAD